MPTVQKMWDFAFSSSSVHIPCWGGTAGSILPLLRAAMFNDNPLRVAEINHDRCGPEPVRLESHVNDPHSEPNTAHGLCQIVQIPPDQPTEGETDQRQDRVFHKVRLGAGLLRDNRELPEAGKVHAHEREKRPEVEQFAGMLIS